MKTPLLSIKKLTASIETKKILDDISLDIEKGKVYAVMGPNGSGKSTLAGVIMGHPAYTLEKNTKIIFNNEPIHELEADERSKKGIFLSFQSPLTLSGVNIYQLMRYATDNTQDPLALRQKIQKTAKELSIAEDLLSRSLNDGFSGGERKKMEVLQAGVLEPQLIIFDEIDTGVDVDSLRTISEYINTMRSPERTFIIITHYNRILDYVEPDEVVIIRKGKIVSQGDKSLAKKIESQGYEAL